jgi:hypothetical protein
MGAGKGFLPTQLKKIFGRHGMAISDPSRLTGKFNAHLRALSFLFCDEVYYPGNKEIEGIVKARISEEFIDVEGKHKDPTTIRNRLHIMMSTNNDWVIPAGDTERRYFIEAVDNKYAKNRMDETARNEYFEALWGEMDNGGREAMLFDLMRYDLRGWHPRKNVPDTDEMRKQKELSYNDYDKAVLAWLDKGELSSNDIRSHNVGTKPDPKDAYFMMSDQFNEMVFVGIDAKTLKRGNRYVGELLKKLGIDTKRNVGDRRKGRVIIGLKQARKNWDKVKGRQDWDDQEKWILVPTNY